MKNYTEIKINNLQLHSKNMNKSHKHHTEGKKIHFFENSLSFIFMVCSHMTFSLCMLHFNKTLPKSRRFKGLCNEYFSVFYKITANMNTYEKVPHSKFPLKYDIKNVCLS